MRRQAEDTGLDTEGDKDDLISRIVGLKRQAEDIDEDVDDKRRGNSKIGKNVKTIENGFNSNTSSSTSFSNSSSIEGKKENSSIVIRKKSKISIDSLPSNLHSLSAPQLRSVCASNGLLHLISKNASKLEILDMIENEVYNDGKKDEMEKKGDGDKNEDEDEDDVSVASDNGGSDIEILN